MKIWGDISKITGIYDRHKGIKKTPEPGKAEPEKDVVSISDKAKDMQIVRQALMREPDIRKDKVDELSRKYRTGAYNPSAKEIAEKIVNSVFDKRV